MYMKNGFGTPGIFSFQKNIKIKLKNYTVVSVDETEQFDSDTSNKVLVFFHVQNILNILLDIPLQITYLFIINPDVQKSSRHNNNQTPEIQKQPSHLESSQLLQGNQIQSISSAHAIHITLPHDAHFI